MHARRRDEDFDEEIRAHLALETDRLVREGLSPERAEAAARRAFGSVARTRERFYQSRRIMWLDDLRRDVRYALRSLARTPGFTAIAVITLALGIGVNSAIFSVVNAVVLRSMPYKDTARFVRISEEMPAAQGGDIRPVGMTRSELEMLRASSWTLSHAGVYLPATFTLSGRERAVRLNGMQVSPAIMDMLGVKPLFGRIFERREDAPLDRVVILSHGAWQRHMGGDPNILGQNLMFDGKPYAVIGVMPAGFYFPEPEAQFWVPFVFPAGARLVVTARLRDGTTRDAASKEIAALLQRSRAGSTIDAPPPPPPPPPPAGGGRRMTLDEALALPPVSMIRQGERRAVPTKSDPLRIRLVGFQEFIVGSARRSLLVLSCAVGFVLMIACVNVANLLLARNAARQREFSVRLALGAGRGRIVRQLLTESTLLAMAGGAAGIGVAVAAVRLLRGLGAGLPRAGFGPSFGLPRIEGIGIDVPVLIFTALLSLAAGVGAGMMPAVRHSRRDQTDDELLRSGGTAPASGFWFRRPRAAAVLVVAEIAMATILFIGGALLTWVGRLPQPSA
jgi:putative ABC transport system permease protein